MGKHLITEVKDSPLDKYQEFHIQSKIKVSYMKNSLLVWNFKVWCI